MKSRLLNILSATVLCTSLVACSKDDDNDVSNANVMVVHASPNAPAVDVRINNNVALSNVAYPTNSNYNDVPGGVTNVKLSPAGTTTYVIGGLETCNNNGVLTGCITCNERSPLSQTAKYPVEVVVGPEFVTGSSRMKAGTAQKLVLNMISTAVMIQLGHVKGNKMVDMQLSNDKLVDRGVRMIMDELTIPREEAEMLLREHKNVRKAIDSYANK